MALKVCLLEAVRRRTFICCRSIQISTSSAARDRIRSTTIQTMSLTRSLITQQHRPILDQLLVRLGLRQGQPIDELYCPNGDMFLTKQLESDFESLPQTTFVLRLGHVPGCDSSLPVLWRQTR